MTRERVEEMVEKVLEVSDTNHDGKLQKPEMVQALVVVQNLAEHQAVGEGRLGVETTTLVIKMCVSIRGLRRGKPDGWRGPLSPTTGQAIPWENAKDLFEIAVHKSKSDLSPCEGAVDGCVMAILCGVGGARMLRCAAVWGVIVFICLCVDVWRRVRVCVCRRLPHQGERKSGMHVCACRPPCACALSRARALSHSLLSACRAAKALRKVRRLRPTKC